MCFILPGLRPFRLARRPLAIGELFAFFFQVDVLRWRVLVFMISFRSCRER
jgi:hypothetical protein